MTDDEKLAWLDGLEDEIWGKIKQQGSVTISHVADLLPVLNAIERCQRIRAGILRNHSLSCQCVHCEVVPV